MLDHNHIKRYRVNIRNMNKEIHGFFHFDGSDNYGADYCALGKGLLRSVFCHLNCLTLLSLCHFIAFFRDILFTCLFVLTL